MKTENNLNLSSSTTPLNDSFQIVAILNHLIDTNVERVDENAPEHFLKMIQLLRAANNQDLESLWALRKRKSAYR